MSQKSAESDFSPAFLNNILGIILGMVSSVKSNTATIAQTGIAHGAFDNSPNEGDYITASSTNLGNCLDEGSAFPSSGQVIGVAITHGVAMTHDGSAVFTVGNLYTVYLFGGACFSGSGGATGAAEAAGAAGATGATGPSTVTYTFGTGGVTANQLVIQSGANGVAATTASAARVLGIAGATGASSSTGPVTRIGSASCVFRNATTAGHYVQANTGTAADCHDTGSATAPTSNQIPGLVMVTNPSAGGTNTVTLFGPGIIGTNTSSSAFTVGNSSSSGALSSGTIPGTANVWWIADGGTVTLPTGTAGPVLILQDATYNGSRGYTVNAGARATSVTRPAPDPGARTIPAQEYSYSFAKEQTSGGSCQLVVWANAYFRCPWRSGGARQYATLPPMTRREWLAITAASQLQASPNDDIDHFFDTFLEKWVRAEPELATSMKIFTGDLQDDLDSRLSDISDEAAHARISLAREGLATLSKFDRTKLDAARRFSADMLDYQLHDIIAEEPWLGYRFPLNQFQGVQVRFPSLMTDLHPLRTRRDAENYLSRLRAAGPKIDQALGIMQTRAKQNVRLPGFISVETVNQMKRFIAPPPAQNILVTSFAERLKKVEGLDDSQRSAMATAAEKIVSDSVYPAWRRAMDGLATTNAKSNDDAGLWRLPKGAEAYAFTLRRFTTTDMTAEQIHRKGLDEVARLEGEMGGLLGKLGYRDGTIIERFQKLQKDNSYPDTPDVRDKILADYARIIKENNERSLEAFDRRPKAACIVQRIPAFQEANAAANYSGPARDGSRPGIFRVPLPGPLFPKPGMRTLAAHEAIPGHHFQIGSQVEMTSLPSFRRQNPFGSMSAYTEGWGLYAERLVSELGWYKDDAVSDIGRLNGELFRARRLVVDTGIHAQRWTREQSIAYGIPQSEVDRYVMMPGQACSYKIGQLKILDLREESKKVMGPKFSLKAYHNVVLGNGQIPLTLLERTVRTWQKEQA